MKKCIIRRIVMKAVNNLLYKYGDDIDKTTEILKVWCEKLEVITGILKSAMDKIEDKELTQEEATELLSQIDAVITDIIKDKK